MKTLSHLLLGALVALLAGCGSCYQCDEVVQESYIHKYGIPVTKQDWRAKGSCGTVVTKLKDGVTKAQNFDGDVLHGECTFTHPHTDTVARSEFYENGVLVRETEMFPSGNPKSEIEHLAGTQAAINTWYEDGTPRSIEQRDGSSILAGQYFSPSNELESEVRNLSGLRVLRDAYGQILSEDEILNGVLTKRTTYHSNGTPKEITPYRNDQPHGLKRSFLASGEPNTIEHWNQGTQTGMSTFYSNGEKVSEVEFIDGERNGVERKFRRETDIVEEVSWAHNKRHGPTRLHLATGTKTDWYHEGKLVSKFAYDELNRKGRR